MDKEDLLQFISRNIPNVPLDEHSVQLIADQFEEVCLEKGDYLLKSGKISGYYILLNGFLRVYTVDTEGNEVTTYFYSNQRVVYDAASFYMKLPSTENIQAVTKAIVFFTTFEKLNELYHSVVEFREFARQMIVREFVAYKQRTLAMINQNTEGRYLNLVETNKDIFQYAPLKYIASYLGVSERTLNRIRKNFTKR